jgi:uncharacterized OB-fold protein
MTSSDLKASPLRTFMHALTGEPGRLTYQYCQACSAAVFYPRVLCPGCGGTSLEWRVSNGRGTVYSTTTTYQRGEAPYNVALIDLEEGFRMMSRVEGIAPEEVRIGMAVRCEVRQSGENDAALVVFVPERGEP